MFTLTKQLCYDYQNDYFSKKKVYFITFPILLILICWRVLNNKEYMLIVGPIILAVYAVLYLITRYKSKNIHSDNVYIIEDAVDKRLSGPFLCGKSSENDVFVLLFDSRLRFKIANNRNRFTIINFQRSKINNSDEIRELCSRCSYHGDKYYLLVYETHFKNTVIQGFPKYHFQLKENEFVCRNGKYMYI